MRPDGRVKVLDFGLARRTSLQTLASQASLPGGTLRYMSPEQCRGDPVASASDVFSLGLVLYELATGQHAFCGDSAVAIAHAIMTEEPLAPTRRPDPTAERVDGSSYRCLPRIPAPAHPPRRSQRELGEILESPAIVSQPATGSVPPYRSWHVILAACSVAVIAAAAWLGMGRRDATEFSDVKIQPLTSQAGWEAAPSVSPDGESIAFTWTPKLDRPKEIYVRRLGGPQPTKLTDYKTASIGYLAWSPDGGRIAFTRALNESGAIYSISSTGGDEKRVVEFTRLNLSSAIDWSPDGSLIAYSDVSPGSDRFGIYLYNVRTGEKRKVTSPPPETWGDWNPKFSPDGSTIAFKRVTGFWADDIYLIPAAGGRLQRITTNGRGIWGHAWTADGKSLLVSCQRNTTIFGIWRFPLSNPGSPERVSQGGVDVIMPSAGRHTKRVAWVNQLWDLNIYRAPLDGDGRPEKLIASTLRDQGAVIRPTGGSPGSAIAPGAGKSGLRTVMGRARCGSPVSMDLKLTIFSGLPTGEN